MDAKFTCYRYRLADGDLCNAQRIGNLLGAIRIEIKGGPVFERKTTTDLDWYEVEVKNTR